MVHKRNGKNDHRVAERRKAAYDRGGSQPQQQVTSQQDTPEAVSREDQECMCGLPRWEHALIGSDHPFVPDPVQDWQMSRAHAEWIGR